ncbi:MAG: hypothetical protein Q8R67_12240 [Rhodoferax sp.]|nr:hypothetical protein [Rhodoferax sp.]MDP3652442.1 hypothetical protein [Rhodoferax sp.]
MKTRNRNRRPSAAPAVVTNLPFPQTTTTAKEWIRAHGVNVAELARHHDIDRLVFADLLRGRLHGYRGKAHKASIILGLKADPATEDVGVTA